MNSDIATAHLDAFRPLTPILGFRRTSQYCASFVRLPDDWSGHVQEIHGQRRIKSVVCPVRTREEEDSGIWAPSTCYWIGQAMEKEGAYLFRHFYIDGEIDAAGMGWIEFEEDISNETYESAYSVQQVQARVILVIEQKKAIAQRAEEILNGITCFGTPTAFVQKRKRFEDESDAAAIACQTADLEECQKLEKKIKV